jgi:hypothetical protein
MQSQFRPRPIGRASNEYLRVSGRIVAPFSSKNERRFGWIFCAL